MTNEETELDRPYKAEPSGLIGFVIRDEDGEIVAWVLGERHARRVAGSLNLAHNCGLITRYDEDTF